MMRIVWLYSNSLPHWENGPTRSLATLPRTVFKFVNLILLRPENNKIYPGLTKQPLSHLLADINRSMENSNES